MLLLLCTKALRTITRCPSIRLLTILSLSLTFSRSLYNPLSLFIHHSVSPPWTLRGLGPDRKNPPSRCLGRETAQLEPVKPNASPPSIRTLITLLSLLPTVADASLNPRQTIMGAPRVRHNQNAPGYLRLKPYPASAHYHYDNCYRNMRPWGVEVLHRGNRYSGGTFSIQW